ncbi:30S ribosomal protein S18 [Candidatus Falkowbacteria bacterium CG10_big_fil_rev_8_21_14_0_10_37_14]|uniref:Small ribosomal subunit protein bS18 n=1 Tax=Candidatus Falkowbacteria bacterium CG10_big_fil_rev_8_21_14_0_10_37_14 TaxID=1974561 RepID=A0A2M6WUL0_9BACT|nr:30S ribosomal protein S18 [Candidatus Falkowbacteria bacterium]PIT96484.1 MAG: 30S ribosomal protein S18 [Candidatus Falkowbacteria bacterium CG10_big_fil_rev_8_21_14_0_10_37_14]
MQIKKSCYYCDNKIDYLDYKDVEELQKFTNSYGLILPKRRTGVCSKHQRKLAMGVKRARVMALALFTNK